MSPAGAVSTAGPAKFKPAKPKLMQLKGRTAVITGAASGIGRALAIGLAARGTQLALADVDLPGLKETAALAGMHGVPITQHRLDVTDRDAIAELPQQVLAEHPSVDILINNAGVAIGGTFEQVSDADFEWLFAINFWGVVRMTRAFLPLLRQSDDASLVNLSSIFGIIAPARNTAYSASKFAVRGFSNSLRAELVNTDVTVTVVHPGGVATAIAKNMRHHQAATADEIDLGQKAAAQFLKLPPEAAAANIIAAIERRQARVLVGRDAKFMAFIERLLPINHGRLLRPLRPR